MRRENIKDQINALRLEGKTLAEIKQIVGCSFSTIAYHLYEKTKRATKTRSSPETKRRYNKTVRGIIACKLAQFRRLGHRYKVVDERKFTINDLSIAENPICYITGDTIDLTDPSCFSLDHKIPSSRGGTNDIKNVGLATSIANRSKTNMTDFEFVDFCKRVVEHNGYKVSKA